MHFPLFCACSLVFSIKAWNSLPFLIVLPCSRRLRITFITIFSSDEDFGSEDDLGADDGKADSDYESSQKNKKGKKVKPDKNKRATSKSRKRAAGKGCVNQVTHCDLVCKSHSAIVKIMVQWD